MTTFSISGRSLPRIPFQKIKDDVLGKEYILSLSFVGSARAQELNTTYRKKTYIPNVLSFPLEKNVGEVYITRSVAKKEAPSFLMSEKGYIGFLFIHALLHLKGYDHGDTMEKAERKYCKKYGLR